MDKFEHDFLKSAIDQSSNTFPTADVLPWIERRRKSVIAVVEEVPLEKLEGWRVDDASGHIVHSSGKFFRIEGVRVHTNWGKIPCWNQPIINQPEVGLLGFVAKKINGILHFMVQAKIEPGNINTVQLSPTVQATKSNYSRVHNGKTPPYLEYFTGEKSVTPLVDQLQSEQGARFLRKRNRNMIVELDAGESITPHEDFIWLTLWQIKHLMGHDNIVNMDTRTALSGIGFGSYRRDELHGLFALSTKPRASYFFLESALNGEFSLRNFREILSWITRQKSTYELSVDRISLKDIRPWTYKKGRIARDDGKFFSVIGVNVSIENREIANWHQPMIMPAQEGLVAFIIRSIEGVYHFLVQAKLEPGYLDTLELAPTVQCLTGNYRDGKNDYSVPYIDDVLSAPSHAILFDVMQSEEGGRFFREQNRNMIVEVGDDFSLDVASNYCWMTLNQLLRLIEFNNFLNISARSLISAIQFN